jgi:hypothetical protein
MVGFDGGATLITVSIIEGSRNEKSTNTHICNWE